MSDLVGRITAIIEEHLVCECRGQWAEDMHEDCQQVAERIVAELGMTAVRCADERWWSTRIERGVY